MRPAFSRIKINSGSLTVEGPIDLNGKETEAYFWVRVTHKPQGKVTAEAVGSAEMDKGDLKQALKKADAKLGQLVNPPAGATAAGGRPTPARIRNVSSMWTATIPITDGTFRKRTDVRIEAWAQVRTERPTRMFNVYWEENGFRLT
jgi:hypothetical protein